MRISDWSSDVCSSDLAEEFPDDAECDTDDNIAVASDYGMLYGEAAGEPTVGLQVGGQGFVKEDAQTDVSITAGTNSVDDTLSQVVITAPAGRVQSGRGSVRGRVGLDVSITGEDGIRDAH